MRKRLYLLVLLIISVTAITLGSTYLFYRTALTASETSLESQAAAVSTTLESSLSKYGLRQDIFRDIILNESWEGIAFLAFYDKNGIILLHSNERMINRRIDEGSPDLIEDSKTPKSSHRVLGTGEDVFMADTPVKVQGKDGFLRVALHTYASQQIIDRARLLFTSVSVMLVMFWVITALFIKSFRKRLVLESVMQQNERLAMLGRMASVLAHEIRNPLGIIKGFAQYLKENAGRPDEKAGKGIDIIINESKRIELLTDDLLVYSRMDDIRAESFDLALLVREISAPFVPGEKMAEMDLDIPERLIIMSDKEKLRQIVYNLMQNSIDAIEDGGRITISLRLDKEAAEVSLSDTGRGISRSDMEKIFMPFYTTKTKGTGLGLAIVDKLVKVLGGSIKAESIKDGLTRFTIRIPDLGKG